MMKQSQIYVKTIIFFLILTLAQMAGSFIYAAEPAQAEENFYQINISQQTADKGYTVKALRGALNLVLPKRVLSGATAVKINKIEEPLAEPWQLEKLSPIFQYELLNLEAYDGLKPLAVEIKYDKPSVYYKQIYFYDKNFSSWRPLSCRELIGQNTLRCDISYGFARLAVFANPDVLVEGRASWYSYKKGNFAASPDFPKGSKLRVYNLENGKSVDVIINDFGPERRLFPDRVIDLDKEAFKKIAKVGQGTIKVKIDPIYIAPKTGRLFGVSGRGAKTEPDISAKAAVIIDEKSGDILWEKSATSTLPLASLTKLVAIKVFLDTRPSLNRVVAYSLKDEEYNYQWVKKWESARLKLNDNDTLTVEDLLYAALVGSANNAVETLVRVSGLARDEFISQMNREAKAWGAVSTKFVEPTGLSPDNVSTPLDYAIITKEVYTNPIIQKASTMSRYKFSTINSQKLHAINNTDILLSISNLNITGSKTGYLDEAKYCLMARALSSGKSVIAVTMGANNRQASFDETEELLKYGFKLMAKEALALAKRE